MSSFNTHAQKVLDESLEIKNRWSHLRSCMNKVSNLANLNRVKIVQIILKNTSVNCEDNESEEELKIAWEYLCSYRDDLLASK